jgi:serine/threonine protein kinase/pimeloyl-ACP methyl ester carboxylesterase
MLWRLRWNACDGGYGHVPAGVGVVVEAELFGPYRLDELIGKGGMGEVFRAYDIRRDRAVALKRLPLALGADAEFVARFRREAAAAARLQAPHIVPIHDYGDIDGRLFIDMRLVNGTDLDKLIATGGPLAPARAVAIITQVASALDDAHAHGLIHRDVKPSNVLLTGDDFAYLTDFGVARALSGGTTLTVTGATVGTLAYMAPERFLGQPGDHLADIYSLTCVLHEELTGSSPFAGEGLPALMYAHVHQNPPRASVQQREVPAALDEVIARGLAKDPSQRYATASQLASAANTALRNPTNIPVGAAARADRPRGISTVMWPRVPEPASGPPNSGKTPEQLFVPPPPPPPQPPSPARPRDRRLVVGLPAAILVLFVAVVVVVLMVKPFDTNPADTNPAQSGLVAPSTAGLERFYGQTLSWGGCTSFAKTPDDQKAYADPGLQCAYLDVPLDYANPNARVIKVGLLRRPASDPASRISSLVIHPGGPGASGMSSAAYYAAKVKDNDVGRRFDLVGFDQRGVGSSQPQIVCQTPAEQDTERLMNLGVDSTPAGVAATESEEKAVNARCVSRTGIDVLAHVGTRDVVRDLDIMRAALGDAKLTYLGYAYSSLIGADYAEVFPNNVRAMILDGAVDPAQDAGSRLLVQAQALQQGFDAFAAWCASRTDCALGPDKNQAVNNFHARVRPLITQPVVLSGGRELPYNDAVIGTIQGLWLPSQWETLNRGLRELAQGHGETLMRFADLYYERDKDGTYSTEMNALQPVLCVDWPPIKDPNVARDIDARYKKLAPFSDTGQPPSPALDNCAFWPVPPTSQPHHPHASGSPPALVISTTQNSVTGYQNGVNLAHDLNARLLTFEGVQPFPFLTQVNGCVDKAGISYLTTLQLPADGSRC